MKYMLLFCNETAERDEWQGRTDAQKEGAYEAIGQWFGANADKLVLTEELKGPETAKTVRINAAGEATVTDGPYMEAKEVIGGFAVFDVADEAAALEMARTWPAGGTVEVRPVVPR
ncbi:MAG: hypothetical protein QOE92_1708 [Chloroflexota bacterium]|nr:hypothetical protein [Chloroflexota bacterium]